MAGCRLMVFSDGVFEMPLAGGGNSTIEDLAETALQLLDAGEFSAPCLSLRLIADLPRCSWFPHAGAMSVFVDVPRPEGDTAQPPEDRPVGTRSSWISAVGLPLLSLLVFFALWQFAAASGVWNETFVPFPSTVWRAFVDVSTVHGDVRGYAGYLLWEHLYMTLRRVLAGVVIGVALPQWQPPPPSSPHPSDWWRRPGHWALRAGMW